MTWSLTIKLIDIIVRIVNLHMGIDAAQLKWNGHKDRIWCCFDETN